MTCLTSPPAPRLQTTSAAATPEPTSGPASGTPIGAMASRQAVMVVPSRRTDRLIG